MGTRKKRTNWRVLLSIQHIITDVLKKLKISAESDLTLCATRNLIRYHFS